MSYQALELNGSGYASIADVSQTGLNMGLGDFMIEILIKTTTDYSGGRGYLAMKSGGVVHGRFLRVNTNNTLGSYLDGAGTPITISATTAINDDTWHKVVFVADKSASGIIYLDGSSDGSSVITAVGDLDNAGDLEVGSRGGGELFTGLLDEVRIWNFGVDGLPADYAAYITWRAQGRNVFLPTSEYDSDSWASYVTNNLSAYYKFNGDYTDETTNGNDLTAVGTGNTFPGYTLKKNQIISPAWMR